MSEDIEDDFEFVEKLTNAVINELIAIINEKDVEICVMLSTLMQIENGEDISEDIGEIMQYMLDKYGYENYEDLKDKAHNVMKDLRATMKKGDEYAEDIQPDQV